ncbi:MAG: hypothetical protein IPO54_02540 [Micavibrio sp.]|nr:hypothetical protein [Micavibrio sp.]
MARILLFVVFLTALVGPARAEESISAYKPGTVGYLYDNCRLALGSATKYTELQETYCGAFSEGYFWGASASNWMLPMTVEEGPCAEEKKREWERINNRFCGNFPKLDDKTTTGDALKSATNIVTRWISFEKQMSDSDPLRRGTLREVNGLVQPGPFCDSLSKSYVVQESPFAINPPLMKMNLRDFMKAKSNMTMKAKYERCKRDVEYAAGDAKKFLSTKCGAEISGYISGVHSTQYLQKNRAELTEECRKPIDRLYKNLDVTQSMCVSYDTNPLWVAELFIKKFPEFKNIEKEQGGIGGLIVWKGFLCAEKAD